jgi:hypothetical protein
VEQATTGGMKPSVATVTPLNGGLDTRVKQEESIEMEIVRTVEVCLLSCQSMVWLYIDSLDEVLSLSRLRILNGDAFDTWVLPAA